LRSREGDPIPAATTPGPAGSDPDFERLERVVTALVEQHRDALRANARLRELLEEREQRLRLADGQILELNQQRQDVAKRIDDLIAQILLLENQLTAAPE
jgi:chromosome segregation ATPase